jgi:hypothetical protein
VLPTECETGKSTQEKANATDKFNSFTQHNQQHCLLEDATPKYQAIVGPLINGLQGCNQKAQFLELRGNRQPCLPSPEAAGRRHHSSSCTHP